METVNTWQEVLQSALTSFGTQFSSALPSVLGAVLLVLIGWLIARSVRKAIGAILGRMNFEGLVEKMEISIALQKANVQMSASEIVALFFQWIVFLFFVVTATNLLGWEIVANEVASFITYLPILFSALVLAIVGLYIASFLRKSLSSVSEALNLSGGKIIADLVFYLIAFVVILTSVKHAGLEVNLVTTNLSILIVALTLSIGLAFILASRDILPNLIAAMHIRSALQIGQNVRIGGESGTVVKVDKVSVVLDVGDKLVSIPASKLLNHIHIES